MTDKDIERRLADALAKSAPDDVEDVMYRCRSSVSSDSKGTVIPLNMAEKNINVNNNVKKKNEKDRKKQLLEEYIEEQIQARKDILEFRKEENFKHKEQNIELNKKALALRAYNQQILEEH